MKTILTYRSLFDYKSAVQTLWTLFTQNAKISMEFWTFWVQLGQWAGSHFFLFFFKKKNVIKLQSQTSTFLTLKSPNRNCSRRHFNFLLLSFGDNKAWFFTWILCPAEDSLETSSLIFQKKKQWKNIYKCHLLQSWLVLLVLRNKVPQGHLFWKPLLE